MKPVKPKCRLGKRKDKHKNSSKITGRYAVANFWKSLYKLDLNDTVLPIGLRTPTVIYCNECGYTRLQNVK